MREIEACPECNSQVFHAEGCLMCQVCGWSACSFGSNQKSEEAELVLEKGAGQ